MNKNNFITRKERLKLFLEKELDFSKNQSIQNIIKILALYNFSNRMKQKGILTRYIIDSAEVDYSIGEKIIEFDNSIK
jgi:hypothetical protein